MGSFRRITWLCMATTVGISINLITLSRRITLAPGVAPFASKNSHDVVRSSSSSIHRFPPLPPPTNDIDHARRARNALRSIGSTTTTGQKRSAGGNRTSTTASVHSLLEPIQVLEQYKQWHSVEALRHDFANNHTSHRRFALGHYACPLQAGNRLHHFLNDLLWSIVTNRTLLWKYFDQETCLDWGEDNLDPNICEARSTESDCAEVMNRASWLPSWDEWSKKLSLPKAEPLHFWSTHSRKVIWWMQRDRAPWQPRYAKSLQGIDVPHHVIAHIPLVRWSMMLGQEDCLESVRKRQQLLKSELARTRAEKLYALGPSFLYGMLFRHSFSPTKALVESSRPRISNITLPGLPPITNLDDNSNLLSFAIHSRHTKSNNTGKVVNRELRCLERLLRQAEQASGGGPNNKRCIVYVLSDRATTLNKLVWRVQSLNCTAVTTASRQSGASFSDEHGPWSGVGFFQDLVVGSRARDGVISKWTTSSMLLAEWIDYDRRMEHVQNSRIPLQEHPRGESLTAPDLLFPPSLPLCMLRDNKPA